MVRTSLDWPYNPRTMGVGFTAHCSIIIVYHSGWVDLSTVGIR